MSTNDRPPTPAMVAGIRNFAWVAPGLVARGQQPPLQAATFAALRGLGIRGVLSLRPDREPPPTVNVRGWPEYDVEEERRLVEGAGLRFRHSPMPDFSAPSPDEIAAALAGLLAEVADSPAVFVHCRAGAGRTTLVTGAWSVTHGRSGDAVVAEFERFMLDIAAARGATPDEWPELYRRVGQPQVLWALQNILHALGSPATSVPASLLPPAPPLGADAWAQGYRDALRPYLTRPYAAS